MEVKITVLNQETKELKNFYGTAELTSIFVRYLEEHEVDVDCLKVVEVECETLNVSGIMKYADDVDLVISIIERLYDFDNVEELYNDLDDKDDLACSEWLSFDEEFFSIYFKDPYEAARSTYFGNIRSWNDNYVRFNGYGNLESTHSIDYDEEAVEIFEQWLSENA